MAVSKERRARSTGSKGSIGLAAIGSSGPWEIAIDQTVTGAGRWFARVEGPSVSLSFEIPSPEIIDRALAFLSSPARSGKNSTHPARDDTLSLGAGRATRVNLIRDDEFCDRYFLSVGPKSGPLVQFTLANQDLTHIIDALRQAKEDLE